MRPSDEAPTWDFSPAIDLLKTLSHSQQGSICPPCHGLSERSLPPDTPLVLSQNTDEELSLGNFGKVWEFLSLSYRGHDEPEKKCLDDAEPATKEVRWRDEVSGADLEDNVDAEQYISAASVRTRKRAARRARARERGDKVASKQISFGIPGSETDSDNDSGQELDRVRRSPDRKAIIEGILRPRRKNVENFLSPPTSPSPPKEVLRGPRTERPISDPFHWSVSTTYPSSRNQLLPLDRLSLEGRASKLIARLRKSFPADAKFLKNKSIIHPEFTSLNTTDPGIHVFIDISNIMIGFHDCLKLSRNMPVSTRTRRIPMSFHRFSLVLERGRPAAKRILVGSDKFPIIQQAKRIGYETNILERVHKVRELTPRQKKFDGGSGLSGLSSGSESNNTRRQEKWVEQAVDEILHLKILESLIDVDMPSTMILATGDAAEAEYSGGFLKMVERALDKGWHVELVSFAANTSGLYKRKQFRSRWAAMFKWVQLDDFVEDLVDDQEI